MADCIINARFKTQSVTGVQRVAVSLSERLSVPCKPVAPGRPLPGPLGHAWEQVVLPWKTGGRLLWSPCNTGPLGVKNQIVTIHDAAIFEHPEWFSADFVRLYHTIVPRLARRVRKVVTVSSYSRTRLAATLGIAPQKIDVIYNGVDAHFSPRSQSEIEAAARLYDVEPFRYFIAVATREPRKNLALLLRAWDAMGDRLPSGFKLLLVGRIGPRTIFADSALGQEPSDGIVTTGYVPDHLLPALMSGAAAMVYPSVYEGFGLPVLEAMACGTPVVTTRLTSLPEVAGEDAVFVDPRDPADLAGVLAMLAREASFRQDLSARGIARAKTFTWQKSAKQMDGLIRSML